MHVYCPGLHVNIVAPNRVQQLLAGIHPAGMFHEMPQQPELCWTKMQAAAAALDPVRGQIQNNVGKSQVLSICCRPGSAHHRADPSHQLGG